MLQGYTMVIVPCGNPTPKKLPTGSGEWPTFRTASTQHTVRALKAPPNPFLQRPVDYDCTCPSLRVAETLHQTEP